jgi:hypothetical protein
VDYGLLEKGANKGYVSYNSLIRSDRHCYLRSRLSLWNTIEASIQCSFMVDYLCCSFCS